LFSHGLTQFFRVLDSRYPPPGGLCLPAGKHTGILTQFQTIVNKKKAKKKVLTGILLNSSITEVTKEKVRERKKLLTPREAKYAGLFMRNLLLWRLLATGYG